MPLRRGLIAASIAGAGYYFYYEQNKKPKRVVIIGGGVMGASTAWSLTSRKEKLQVTLIDANHPIRGSWHESRIIRAAYEDKMYVGMVMRAFEHWSHLEKEAGKGKLMHMTGILDIGEKFRLKDLLQNYIDLGMPVEVYSGATKESRAQFEARFPTIRLGPKQEAVFQKDTGMLLADVSVQAMLEISVKKGATLHLDDAVVKIDRKNKTVTTQKGVICEYDSLVVAAGPWTNATLSKAKLSLLPLVISNEQAVYLQSKKGVNDLQMEPSKSPVVVEHDANIYAVPHLPGGVGGCKIGAHAQGDFMNNDEFILPTGARQLLKQLEQPNKQVYSEQIDAIHKPMLKVVQDSAKLTFPLLDATTGADTYTRCLYQNLMRNDKAIGKMSEYSSDFAVGPHPEDPNVLVTAGFTGEGFKFGPVIGELLADIVLGVKKVRVPDMKKRFALDNGSIDFFSYEENSNKK
jgi:glycine/D-amino acid oxidase-like deaminating enzyme